MNKFFDTRSFIYFDENLGRPSVEIENPNSQSEKQEAEVEKDYDVIPSLSEMIISFAEEAGHKIEGDPIDYNRMEDVFRKMQGKSENIGELVETKAFADLMSLSLPDYRTKEFIIKKIDEIQDLNEDSLNTLRNETKTYRREIIENQVKDILSIMEIELDIKLLNQIVESVLRSEASKPLDKENTNDISIEELERFLESKEFADLYRNNKLEGIHLEDIKQSINSTKEKEKKSKVNEYIKKLSSDMEVDLGDKAHDKIVGFAVQLEVNSWKKEIAKLIDFASQSKEHEKYLIKEINEMGGLDTGEINNLLKNVKVKVKVEQGVKGLVTGMQVEVDEKQFDELVKFALQHEGDSWKKEVGEMLANVHDDIREAKESGLDLEKISNASITDKVVRQRKMKTKTDDEIAKSEMRRTLARPMSMMIQNDKKPETAKPEQPKSEKTKDREPIKRRQSEFMTNVGKLTRGASRILAASTGSKKSHAEDVTEKRKNKEKEGNQGVGPK